MAKFTRDVASFFSGFFVIAGTLITLVFIIISDTSVDRLKGLAVGIVYIIIGIILAKTSRKSLLAIIVDLLFSWI